jgi:hypothetical protein
MSAQKQHHKETPNSQESFQTRYFVIGASPPQGELTRFGNSFLPWSLFDKASVDVWLGNARRLLSRFFLGRTSLVPP